MKYTFSYDDVYWGEDFYDSIEDCLKAVDPEDVEMDGVVYIGEVIEFEPYRFDAEEILEKMRDYMIWKSRIDDIENTYLIDDVSEEDKKVLERKINKAIKEWAYTHGVKLNQVGIDNIKAYEVK